MLSDEERKAIANLKTEYEKLIKEDNILFPLYKSDAKRLINIIEKQSKEIEELKEELNRQINTRTINEEYVEKKCISTKEIKEILGIEENIDNEKLLSLLQTIVDENSRLEDIEDRKVQIEYNNVFNKGIKSVEDKIKAKIEERQKRIEQLHPGSDCVIIDDLETEIAVLQSLLEKE